MSFLHNLSRGSIGWSLWLDSVRSKLGNVSIVLVWLSSGRALYLVSFVQCNAIHSKAFLIQFTEQATEMYPAKKRTNTKSKRRMERRSGGQCSHIFFRVRPRSAFYRIPRSDLAPGAIEFSSSPFFFSYYLAFYWSGVWCSDGGWASCGL